MTNQELLTRIQKLDPEIGAENTDICIVEPELPKPEEDIDICPEPKEEELPPEETIDYD